MTIVAEKIEPSIIPDVNVSETQEQNTPAVKKMYEITSDVSMGSIKRTVEVLLYERIDKDRIQEIAYEILNMKQNKYERSFIFYYLPEMEVHGEDLPYAISHFDPKLEVKIFGYNGRKVNLPDKKYIGKWDFGVYGTIVYIYQEEEKFYVGILCDDDTGDCYEAFIRTIQDTNAKKVCLRIVYYILMIRDN